MTPRVVIDVHIDIATYLSAGNWESIIRSRLAETQLIEDFVPGDVVTITAHEVEPEEAAA